MIDKFSIFRQSTYIHCKRCKAPSGRKIRNPELIREEREDLKRRMMAQFYASNEVDYDNTGEYANNEDLYD